MTQLQTMYPGVANSPDTFLKEDLAKDATVMYLSDGSVLGKLPTLAVIGGGADAETVLVTSTRSDGGFTIERGVEGDQKAWKKADLVARNWTNKDYETIRANIKAVNDGKVDKVSGKGLCSNDYTDAAKKKVDGIPANPKYTDTVADLTPYAKKEDLPTKLSQLTEDSEHRTVTDAEKKSWNEKLSLDKQYLYDILMGESLVTKKAGEWPEVHGKPTSIDNFAFDDNQLTEVKIPPSVTSIGTMAFSNNQLTAVTIPNSVTSTGNSVFYGNQLTEVKILHGVKSVENGMFRNNQLTSVIIPPSVTSVDDHAFRNNQLTSVVIPPSVTNIGSFAFKENQLTEVKVPKNCAIGENAFDAGVNIIRY